jgi:hypothetical protein
MILHIDHHSVDDHPATMFGLLVGTLAVLVTVIVFSIYDNVQQASQNHLNGVGPQAPIIRTN